MKWVLVWILIYPPAGPNKNTTWEYAQEPMATMEQCFSKLAAKDAEFKDRTEAGELLGHEIYCKERYVE